MYTAFLERTQRGIDSLKKHLATSDALRAAIYEGVLTCKDETPCFRQPLFSMEAAPDRLEWRLIDHCTAVTRIYAIYEQFAQEMVREHLSLLQAHVAFQDLPECLRNSYRKGLAEILGKKDGPRYGNLNLKDLIAQYDRALSGKPYILEPVAMLMQEQNLRLPELRRLFAACDIVNVDVWIEKHRCVKEFFKTDGRLAGSAEHEMIELIGYRNDAAHGSINVDELPGLDYLFEFCDFVSAICEALSERVQMTGLERLIASGHAEQRGKVSECLKSDMVVIANVSGDFKVGDTIYLCSDVFCMARTIINIQVNGINKLDVSLVEEAELGFAIDKPGRNRATVITISPAPSTVVDIPLANDDEAAAHGE